MHCVQRDSSKLSYQSRHNSAGYVYIAGSRNARLVNIGTAVDIPQRERNLRMQRYADIDDWVILFSAKVATGGRIEGEALRRLAPYKVSLEYKKDGAAQFAEQVLQTTFSRAIKVLRAVLEGCESSDPWRHPHWKDYDFK